MGINGRNSNFLDGSFVSHPVEQNPHRDPVPYWALCEIRLADSKTPSPRGPLGPPAELVLALVEGAGD